jgi:hypothetical protein
MKKLALMILPLIVVLAFAVPVLAWDNDNHGPSEINGWTDTNTQLFQNWQFTGGCDGCDSMSLNMSSGAYQAGKAGLEIHGKNMGGDFGYGTGYFQEQNAPGAIQQSWGSQYGEVYTSSH